MTAQKPIVYLLTGQGGDERLFNNFELGPAYELRHINYFTPEKGLTMRQFAEALAIQIDQSRPYIIIGVSLGGMLATEMNSFLNPEKTIIISSAKTRMELPRRLRFQSKIPLYKLVSSNMAWRGAKILQPLVEPDRNKEKETFKKMLEDKDPLFLRRTITMIMQWDRVVLQEDIIHIHGDNDKTIPIRNVKYDYLVPNGSHMITLTRGTEISKLVNEILKG